MTELSLKKTFKVFTKYKTELLALILAFITGISVLLIGNCPYPFWDRIDWLCFAENFVRNTFGEAEDDNDAFFVNVGYDKQIVNRQVTTTDIGHSVITDRKVLLDFLTIAEKANYKYIFLDIRFEKGYNTEWDKALFSQIAKMNNIVVAHHFESPNENNKSTVFNKFEIADSILMSKIAYNDYHTTIFSSSFTRYQYLQENRISVALRMYQDINGKTINRKSGLYFNDGTLCENCPFIPLKRRIEQPIGDGTEADYLNLGPFLMTLPEEILVSDLDGKIIVVGDFIDDIHDTYMGMHSGPYLTYLAYKYLAKGNNNVSFTIWAFMTLVFYFIIRTKLTGKSIFSGLQFILNKPYMKWTARIKEWRITNLIVNLFTYTILLTIACTIVYLISGYAFNVGFPALIISLISSIKKITKKEIK